MASLSEAYSGAVVFGTPQEQAARNPHLTTDERFALLKEAYSHPPRVGMEGQEAAFAPETGQAAKCVARYREITKQAKDLDERIAAEEAKIRKIGAFHESYRELVKAFAPIRELLAETPPPAPDVAPPDDDALAAAREEMARDLKESEEAFNAQNDRLQRCKTRWGSAASERIAALRRRRDALDAETAVLREFLSEGFRELKSALPTDSAEIANPCAICFAAAVDTAIVPCGHTFCMGCLSVRNVGVLHRCPSCRGLVQNTIKLFL